MSSIFFREEGEGNPLLLIHGFPMNSDIWSEIKTLLVPSFRVITIDLPGFGKSPLLAPAFSLEDVARAVLMALEERGISKTVIIGHSLGGYVALAMMAQRPDWFPGAGLIHSTALADNEEKKRSRSKVIKFIGKNGAEAFTSAFITPLFANREHSKIASVREMNMQSGAQTLTAYMAAMRDRPDRTDVLKLYPNPLLFIAGAHDPGIPVETVTRQSTLARFPEVHVLRDQSHMALVEDAPLIAGILKDFTAGCYMKP